MSRKYNKPGRRRLGRTGVTTLEFALVALLFLTVLIGCMDLGRYYVVEHSLRTIVAEAARARLVGAIGNGTVNPATARFAAITPFMDDANLTLQVTETPAARPTATTITVTGTYAFTAFSPIWRSLNGNITETTELSY